MAKELRAVEDVRPPHKVTDYSSSSEESGTTDEEDEDAEQEGAEEPSSGAEDTRAPSVLGVFKVLSHWAFFPCGHFPPVPIPQVPSTGATSTTLATNSLCF